MNVDAPKREREGERKREREVGIVMLSDYHLSMSYIHRVLSQGQKGKTIPEIEIVSAVSASINTCICSGKLSLIFSIHPSINQSITPSPSPSSSSFCLIPHPHQTGWIPPEPSRMTSTHFQSTLLQALQTLQALLIQFPSLCPTPQSAIRPRHQNQGHYTFCTLQNPPPRRSFGWI